MNRESLRFLWEEGMPAQIRESLEPYRFRLDGTYDDMTSILEMGLVEHDLEFSYCCFRLFFLTRRNPPGFLTPLSAVGLFDLNRPATYTQQCSVEALVGVSR